jgi:MraZ protein
VVTKGLDNCLQVLTKKNWVNESEKMAALPPTEKTSRQLRRALFSGAIDSKLDTAGRIQIPENLRKYSEIGINDDVTVTGSGPVIEIWSTKIWKKIQNDADKAFANINEMKG